MRAKNRHEGKAEIHGKEGECVKLIPRWSHFGLASSSQSTRSSRIDSAFWAPLLKAVKGASSSKEVSKHMTTALMRPEETTRFAEWHWVLSKHPVPRLAWLSKARSTMPSLLITSLFSFLCFVCLFVSFETWLPNWDSCSVITKIPEVLPPPHPWYLSYLEHLFLAS